MAELVAPRPMPRWPVSATTGAKALLAAGATEAGSQQSLTLAIIAGGFVVVGSIAGPIVTEMVRQKRRLPTDVTDTQAELLNHVIDHLSTELAAAEAARAELQAEVARLKRRRRA